MTHDDILLKATLNLEQALDPEEQRFVETHLLDCADCRDEWARMHAAHGALTTSGIEIAASPAPQHTAPAAPLAMATSSRAWPLLLAASLVGAVIGAGGVLGVAAVGAGDDAPSAGASPDTRPVFALLLEETPESWPPVPGAMRRGYVEWRDSHDAGGAFAGGQQFVEDEGWLVASGGDAPVSQVPPAIRGATTYSGIFLVRAGTYDEAVAIARGSPHLAYGAILVRAVR